MAELKILYDFELAHIVVCKGKPASKEDVQHYLVPCDRCGAKIELRPTFFKQVEGGLEEICWECAEKEGFDKVFHNNKSFWNWSKEKGWVRVISIA